MTLASVFKGGILFIVGIFVGVQLGIFYFSYFYSSSSFSSPSPANPLALPPPVCINPVQNNNNLFNNNINNNNNNNNKYYKENKEFLKSYPNPCVPLGNKQVACLPNFIIIGAMKAGTTFIDHYLQQHPMVAKHLQKEIFFFSQQHFNGIQWYSNHFENVTLGDGKVMGEATPVYLGWPLAPERARISVPNVKLIVTLRDPVERTYSQYFHSIRWLKSETKADLWQSFEQLLEEEIRVMRHCGLYPGMEFPTFMETIEKEEVFYSHCYSSCGDCFPFNNSIHGAGNPAFGLLAKSLYYYQIENWFKVFPRDQFLIKKYEDLEENGNLVLNDILEFLNLDPYNYESLKPKNVNRYPEMNPDTRKKLNDFFRAHTLKLYDLLDTDFGWDSMKT